MDRRAFFFQTGLSLIAAAPEASPTPPAPALSVIDAKIQFGAVGDGKTDDTASLQGAIDTAVAAGVNLYIPPGVYKPTSSLTVGKREQQNRADESPET